MWRRTVKNNRSRRGCLHFQFFLTSPPFGDWGSNLSATKGAPNAMWVNRFSVYPAPSPCPFSSHPTSLILAGNARVLSKRSTNAKGGSEVSVFIFSSSSSSQLFFPSPCAATPPPPRGHPPRRVAELAERERPSGRGCRTSSWRCPSRGPCCTWPPSCGRRRDAATRKARATPSASNRSVKANFFKKANPKTHMNDFRCSFL